MCNLCIRALREEDGQGMAEYALMLALVSIALITAISNFGNGLASFYTNFLQLFP